MCNGAGFTQKLNRPEIDSAERERTHPFILSVTVAALVPENPHRVMQMFFWIMPRRGMLVG
jgi:hypothetical protein